MNLHMQNVLNIIAENNKWYKIYQIGQSGLKAYKNKDFTPIAKEAFGMVPGMEQLEIANEIFLYLDDITRPQIVDNQEVSKILNEQMIRNCNIWDLQQKVDSFKEKNALTGLKNFEGMATSFCNNDYTMGKLSNEQRTEFSNTLSAYRTILQMTDSKLENCKFNLDIARTTSAEGSMLDKDIISKTVLGNENIGKLLEDEFQQNIDNLNEMKEKLDTLMSGKNNKRIDEEISGFYNGYPPDDLPTGGGAVVSLRESGVKDIEENKLYKVSKGGITEKTSGFEELGQIAVKIPEEISDESKDQKIKRNEMKNENEFHDLEQIKTTIEENTPAKDAKLASKAEITEEVQRNEGKTLAEGNEKAKEVAQSEKDTAENQSNGKSNGSGYAYYRGYGYW